MDGISWCRRCLKWVADAHFVLPDGSELGCGQGDVDTRYHPGMPRHGDVWHVGVDLYLVLDYVSPNLRCLSGTLSTGNAMHFPNTPTLVHYLRSVNAAIVSMHEDRPYKRNSQDGFSVERPPPDRVRSKKFIEKVVGYKL